MFDVHGTVHRQCTPLSITNKMQRYTIFFIAVKALHVSGGFSAHHQKLKTVHTASGICKACLLLPLAIKNIVKRCTLLVIQYSLLLSMLAVAASKLDIYQMLYLQFELLMVGGTTS